jgi:hypothetical protein
VTHELRFWSVGPAHDAYKIYTIYIQNVYTEDEIIGVISQEAAALRLSKEERPVYHCFQERS